jgi:hypothetical protein
MRQVESNHRKAIADYNRAVRQVNAAINNYNREASAHNARVRANALRLRRELAQLSVRPPSITRRIRYSSSVTTLHDVFLRFEAASERTALGVGRDLIDLSEGEAANSVAVLNALAAGAALVGPDDPGIRRSSITTELSAVDPDLDARWSGALYALDPRNPDAARHFCTSSREILTRIIDVAAPEAAVLAFDPNAPRLADGRVTRRTRIEFGLRRRGIEAPEFADFVDHDVENVLTLFREFNDATHGAAGHFSVNQLRALKVRVEDAIIFLHRVLI